MPSIQFRCLLVHIPPPTSLLSFIDPFIYLCNAIYSKRIRLVFTSGKHKNAPPGGPYIYAMLDSYMCWAIASEATSMYQLLVQFWNVFIFNLKCNDNKNNKVQNIQFGSGISFGQLVIEIEQKHKFKEQRGPSLVPKEKVVYKYGK
ncbi:hypothetical protein VNO77_22808 [Canavalia gladiata]|uniref:Uncharacterized protein n=1 Tax=Canavalia gladiata TaxID=3824 RepID=A0AAN9L4Q8_CANGL